MSTRIDLPPELEAFARDCVTSGRYSDTNDVIRAALRRLHHAETRRSSFNAMLARTRAEAERHGTHDVDAVLEEVDEAVTILAATGLTMSDAFGMILVRTVAERRLSLDPLVPNAKTIEAMQAARSGDTRKAGAPEILLAHLHEDD